eukprot:3940735-Rhodomonas_salina.4
MSGTDIGYWVKGYPVLDARYLVVLSSGLRAVLSSGMVLGASSFNLLGKCLRLFAALEPVCPYPRLLRDI